MELTYEQMLNNYLSILACDTAKINFSFSTLKMVKGNYKFIFGIDDGITDPSINSRRGNLLINY